MNAKGFTLIELLVAMAITGILAGLVMTFFSSTSDGVTQQTHVATQTAVVQRALGLMGDDIRRAELIVPVDSAFTLPLGTSGLTAPSKTGADRFDVYVVTPATGSSCTTTYEFRSYFLVGRSVVTGLTDTWLQLPNDTANSAQKVLVQFLGCSNSLTAPSSGNVRLVADYIKQFQVTYGASNELTLTLQGQRTLRGRLLTSPLTPATGTYYSRRM